MNMSTKAPIPLTTRLSAIAEPVRLRLARLLDLSELSVGEVAKVLQLPQSTVSRHLKVLASAGWVHRRTEGTATLYQLVRDDLPEDARALWATICSSSGDDPDIQEDRRRLDVVLAQRRTDSRSFFGRVAGEWDLVRRELFGDAVSALALHALLDPDWVVADIGCGTGNAAELLSPHVRKVIAIDFSEPMLDAARRRLDGADNVDFLVGSIDGLPLDDGSVDAVVVLLVLHHVEDVEDALKELRRVVRPGGAALIVDMFEHTREEYQRTMGHAHLGFDPDGLSAALKRAGFDHARVAPLPGDAESKGPTLFTAVARVAPPTSKHDGGTR